MVNEGGRKWLTYIDDSSTDSQTSREQRMDETNDLEESALNDLRGDS